MSQFTQFTSIEPIPKRNLRVTTQDMYWELGAEGSNRYIHVPVGYEFDGCTIPKIFGAIVQKVEARTINAGCIHDYIYTEVDVLIYVKNGAEYIPLQTRTFTRREADDVFYDACVACGTPRRLARTMWAVIRMCGYPIRAGRIHTT